MWGSSEVKVKPLVGTNPSRQSFEVSIAQPVFTVDGNRLTLLESGGERLDALLALIDGARTSLRLLYYIYADDETGHRVNAALLAAAARGVSVSLIVDGLGVKLRGDPHLFDPLREAGIAVCLFSPRWGRRYLLRNHQKLALADGESGADARIIVGGFNIEDDYLGIAPSPELVWRDLGLLVEGPVAAQMADYFDALSTWIRSNDPRMAKLNRALARYSSGDGALRWLIGGPTPRLSPWARQIRSELGTATRIGIIAGYFAPSPSFLRQLDLAARRGGDVRVISAALSDHPNAVAAARFTFAGLLRSGVYIFEYLPSKLHTKLYLVDGAVHIGSANFDMRSLFINLELMLRIEDAAFAAHLRHYFEGEAARCQAVDASWYRDHASWGQRARQFAAYALLAIIDPRVSRGLN